MQKTFCDKCGREMHEQEHLCRISIDSYVCRDNSVWYVTTMERNQSDSRYDPENSIFSAKEHYKSEPTYETEICTDCFKKIWESFKK